jgi:hypothetical protein
MIGDVAQSSSSVTKVMRSSGDSSNYANNAYTADETLKMSLSSLRLEGSYFVQPLFKVERMIDPKKI